MVVLIVAGLVCLALIAAVLHFAGEARCWEHLATDAQARAIAEGESHRRTMDSWSAALDHHDAEMAKADATADRDAETIAALRRQLARQERMAEHAKLPPKWERDCRYVLHRRHPLAAPARPTGGAMIWNRIDDDHFLDASYGVEPLVIRFTVWVDDHSKREECCTARGYIRFGGTEYILWRKKSASPEAAAILCESWLADWLRDSAAGVCVHCKDHGTDYEGGDYCPTCGGVPCLT